MPNIYPTSIRANGTPPRYPYSAGARSSNQQSALMREQANQTSPTPQNIPITVNESASLIQHFSSHFQGVCHDTIDGITIPKNYKPRSVPLIDTTPIAMPVIAPPIEVIGQVIPEAPSYSEYLANLNTHSLPEQ